ncbi:MAG TPA: VWA domain-containing protein, partial [Armatimonadetes bacterium]|nr:VWA domain-containing protein [Armatimonadota bacterium]
DKVGLIMFTDCIERFVPPRKGRKHILRLVRDILVVEPSSQRTDISTALAFLNRVQRRRAVIFLISDFHDQAGVHALKVAARHHDLLALMVSDPLEQSLPSIGWVRFEDAETGEQVLVNTSDKRFRQRFAALVDQHRQFWRQLFQSAQIDYVELSTNEPYIIPLWRMFRERHRRFRR